MTPEKLEKLRELALNNPNEEEARSAALAYLRAEAEMRGPAPKAQTVSFSSVQSKGKYQTQEEYNAALKERAQEARRSVINNILGRQTDKEVQLQTLVEKLRMELALETRHNLQLQKELDDANTCYEGSLEFREFLKAELRAAQLEADALRHTSTTWELLVIITRRILCLSPSSANPNS